MVNPEPIQNGRPQEPASSRRGTNASWYASLWIQGFGLQCALKASSSQKTSQPTETVDPTPTSHALKEHGLRGLQETPAALVDGASNQGLLLEVNPAAQEQGVHAAMSASRALARCPSLLLLNADAPAERLNAERLLRFIESLSPRFEKQTPNRWLLDLRGIPETNWQTWSRRAMERLASEEGFAGILGVAQRPGLAWCAARKAEPLHGIKTAGFQAGTRVVLEPESFVNALTFQELEVSETLSSMLHDWGLQTLGDLLQLPRQAALERLGPEAASLWEIAYDSKQSVLRLEAFPEPLQLKTDFEHPVETSLQALFCIHRMLEELCSRLRLLNRVASALELSLCLENAPGYSRLFHIPNPTRDEAVLRRILETHFENLHLPAPLTSVFLKIQATLPSSHQLALFENPLRDPHRFSETIARIQAIAGPHRVGVPFALNTHQPDAFLLEDPLRVFANHAPSPLLPLPPQSREKSPLGLPLHRFRPPLQAEVSLSNHRPAHLHCHGLSGKIRAALGPYRSGGQWWGPTAWRREEWDIDLGARGLFRIAHLLQPTTGWQVEGCYDAAAWPDLTTQKTSEGG